MDSSDSINLKLLVPTMRELPILFSAPMVRAQPGILKTQTRRIAKPQPFSRFWARNDHRFAYVCGRAGQGDEVDGLYAFSTSSGGQWQAKCPYGQPSDHLWVKETFFAWGRWETRFNTAKGRDEWHFVDLTVESGLAYRYAADETVDVDRRRAGPVCWWKRPAIFMPRRASRITLEVTAVRVERLQDISEADAVAEGIHTVVIGSGYQDRFSAELATFAGVMEQQADTYEDPRMAYRDLWESINGAGSWTANPCVWVVQFRRVEGVR